MICVVLGLIGLIAVTLLVIVGAARLFIGPITPKDLED